MVWAVSLMIILNPAYALTIRPQVGKVQQQFYGWNGRTLVIIEEAHVHYEAQKAIVEILKSWLHGGQRPPFYFYRDKEGREIDLLIIRDNTIHPLEFKKTSSPNKNAVSHFPLLEKFNMKIGYGGVICLVNRSLPITDRASSIPVTAL